MVICEYSNGWIKWILVLRIYADIFSGSGVSVLCRFRRWAVSRKHVWSLAVTSGTVKVGPYWVAFGSRFLCARFESFRSCCCCAVAQKSRTVCGSDTRLIAGHGRWSKHGDALQRSTFMHLAGFAPTRCTKCMMLQTKPTKLARLLSGSLDHLNDYGHFTKFGLLSIFC